MKLKQAGSAALLAGFLAIFAGKYPPQEPARVSPHLRGQIETLIVGGGPNKEYNQAGIESNVRYVSQLLPQHSPRRVLFANGDRRTKTVYCEDSHGDYFREPKLPKIDGPSTNTAVTTELSKMARHLASRPGTPALLFFTGHGGGDHEGNFKNNFYCTWNDDQFGVTDLAKGIASFPKSTPIVLVMVECYSGGFGNLLFSEGNPKGSMVDRPICGFFAATDRRMSAGCTPEINEANYRDFTGYFFAALSGVDRMGKAVSGADFDHDGKVTMDEAFAYALIHDDSIDTPVCTSDVFLRRYENLDNELCFKVPYSEVASWSTPAQLAALQDLRKELNIGESEMQKAYDEFNNANQDSEASRFVHLTRLCRLYKTVVLTHHLLLSGDDHLVERFRDLIAQEHSNPLTDSPKIILARQ